MKHDFAVIGAGISGLSAALLLAGFGHQVVLIEQGGRPAGLVRGFTRRGVRFDTGFHYAGGLGRGDVLDLFFRHLGVADRLQPEPLDPEGFDIVRCERPAFEFRFPCGMPRLQDRLTEAFPRERAAIAGFLQDLERAAASLPYMNLAAPFAAAPEGLHGPTLQEVLDRHTGNPLLKAVLSLHTLLHGVAPAEVPFALHAVVAAPYYRSAHTVRGGGEALAAAFEAELARRGVEVLCGEGAEEILLGSDGRPAGVRLTGGRLVGCSACIATVHPRTLLGLVPEGAFRPVYRRRLESLEETPSACLLFGARSEPAAELRPANLFLLPDPEAAGRLEDGPDGSTLYVTTAQPAAEGGGGGYLALAPVSTELTFRWRGSAPGRRPADYLDWKERMTGAMRRRLERSSPEWAAGTSWSEGATPLTLADFGHTPSGSLYGVKHRVGQFNPQAATRVPGLWLAGQGTAAPGVLGAVISAYLACGEVVGHERLRAELGRCR